MIAYFTNIWNHYQAPWGYAMAQTLGEKNFRMVLVRTNGHPLTKMRKALGWKFDVPPEPWIVPNPETDEDIKKGCYGRLLLDADVVVLGATEGHLAKEIRQRMRSGKLTFFTNERFFKQPRQWYEYINPRRLASWLRSHFFYNHPNVHYLPISYYGAEDMRFFHACQNRMWKWAYYPAVDPRPIEKPYNDKLEIGWCGRFIEWKHVECAIQMMAKLPQHVRDRCRLTLVGTGEKESDLKAMANDLNLSDCVSFHTSMTPTEISEWMSGLDVYVFPSDRNEGWGVVLAEAMNKCCVPLASIEAGATPNLVDDGENGFVFEKGDVKGMAMRLEWLAVNRDECHKIGLNAWRKMQQWSPAVGARRLVALISNLNSGGSGRIFSSGLCSEA